MGLRSLFSEPEEISSDVLPQRQFGGSNLATGAELGLRGMQSAGYELINDPAGAAYARAQAASVPAQYRSSEDVDWTSPSSISGYAAQQMGQMGVSTLPTLAAGLGGAGIARTILGKAAENLTEAELARRAATMFNAGRASAGAASSAQGYGDMAGELRAQGKEPGAFTALLSLGHGAADVFGLHAGFKSLVKSAGDDAIRAAANSSAASRILKGAAAGAADITIAEQPPELTQEAFAIANRAYYDPAYRENTDDMWGRAKETAIATMFGAGVPGAGAGAIGGLRSAPGSTPEVTPEADTKDTSVLDQIKQAPHHDMSLEELRALDSSTSSGETNGESQNATEESTLPPNETGKRQEVLAPAGASAPATIPTIDLTKRQPNSFKVTGAAAARDPSLSKTDPRLVEILRVAAETSPEFTAEAFSGIRKINPKHPDAIQHPDGAALDITLADRKTGKKYDGNYQDSANFDVYERFAQHAKRVQEQLYPELNDTFTWGGYFSGPKGKYGAVDLMHFDLRSRHAHAAAGGSWATGLNEQQRKLFPGAKSQGMGGVQQTGAAAPKATQSMPAYESPFEVDKDGKYYGYYKPRGITGGLLSDPKFLQRIDEVEAKHGIPSGTLQALMAKESNGRPEAISPADPQGLHGWGIGQFRNATARGLAKQTGIPIWQDNKVNMDPYVQVEAMGELLTRKRKAVGGDWDDAAWAYNAGEKNVLNYKREGKYSQFADKVDPNYKREVVANRDAILRARGAQPSRVQNQTTDARFEVQAEASELARRVYNNEPLEQDTALGRAIKGQTESDSEQTGQTYADEGLQFEDTDDGFSLTFKGKKRESTGEDLMRPSRPLAEVEEDTFEGMTPESTPVRAFTEVLYPGAKIKLSGKDTPNLQRIVSVQFPEEQRQALGEDQKYTARASLEALHSGAKADQKDKILLEHPSVLNTDKKSKNYGKPIEIPVTKEGLAKIGRALDPGAYDSAPSASHAAAVSGLTHLIYEKGFVPRGVDIKKLEQATKEVGKLGKKPFEIVKAPFGKPVPEGVVDGHRAGGKNITNAAPNTPGWLGNPFFASDVKGGKLSRKEAVAKFREVFLQRVNSDPAFQDAVLALRGKKVGYYKPDEQDIHLQVVQDWLASQERGAKSSAPSAKPVDPINSYADYVAAYGSSPTKYKRGQVVPISLEDGTTHEAKVAGSVDFHGVPLIIHREIDGKGWVAADPVSGKIAARGRTIKDIKDNAPQETEGPAAKKFYALLAKARGQDTEVSTDTASQTRETGKPVDPIATWIGEKLGAAPKDRTPDMQARLDISKAKLSEKQKAHPYFAKDQAKAKRANKFIGRGSSVSSTEAYRKAIGAQANTGQYTKDDIVFISAEGNRKYRVLPNLDEIDKAVEAGATFITDTKGHRDREYNVGEREVAAHLTAHGYKEIEPGLWAPSAVEGRKVGSSRMEGQTPSQGAGGFTGEDPTQRTDYEGKPGYTPLQQAALTELTRLAQKYVREVGPEPSEFDGPSDWEEWAKQKYFAWSDAVDRAVREIDLKSIRLPPTTFTHELGADGKTPEPVVLRREDAPRRSGIRRPERVSPQNIVAAGELAKKEFSAALYAKRRSTEREEINREAGKNLDSMPLWDELTEDQLLATEAEAGVADDRAAMKDRAQSLGPAADRSLKWNNIQGLSSDINTTLARQEKNPPKHNDPGPAKKAVRKKTTETVSKVEKLGERTRELNKQNIETVHKVSGGATVRATGVSDKIVKFFTEALKDIGLEVPLRVMSKAGITQHLDALQRRLDGLYEAVQREGEALQRMPNMLAEEKKARKEQEKKVQTLRRAMQDASEEQRLLMEAMEDQYAARVIYNDHYQDATRRVPVIVVSDEAAASRNLTKVLGHELGHVVQRAWFDQLPADLQKDIMQELSENGVYTGDIAEAFADKFLSWYERNKRGEKIKSKQEDIRTNKMEGVLQRLVNALQRLWNNLVGHDKDFARGYPKFDEFLRSTVARKNGGRMKPINPEVNKLWTESLAQPYGGLPLAVANREQFNDMSPEEYRAKVAEGVQAAKDRAAQYAKNKAGENVVRQRYLRKANETYDAFKKMAAVALEADGTWLRNAGDGILKGYANIVAPIKGRVMSGMQVIKPVLVQAARSNTPAQYAETRAMNGSIQTLNDLEYGKWRKRLDPLLNRVSKLTPEEYKSLLADLRDETTPSKTDLAKDIRSYFAGMLRYMRAHEVRVGARSGYYTKAWDLVKLDDNKEAAIAAFEKVFAAREELPVDPRVQVAPGQEPVRFSTPRAAAIYEHRRITEGRVDNVFEQLDEEMDPELRGPSFRFARHRMFTNEEYDKFGLNDWLNDDIGWTMNTYTQLGIKRATQQMATGIPKSQRTNMTLRKYWEGRFTKAKLRPEVMHSPVASLELLLAEGIQDGRLSEEDYLEARKRILSVMGQTNVGSDPRMRRWTSRILAYETLRTLTWGAFAQLADFGISAWRADSMNRVGKVMGQMLDKQTREQQEELLRTIGLSLDELTRHALNSGMMTTDPVQKGTQWVTEKFFKLNGMHKMSEANLLFSSMLGQSYLKEYADQALNGATETERDTAMKRIRELHPSITPAEILTGNFATDAPLQIALHEYVSQSHLHNQIGYTPRLFNDYRFAIFTQLKGFMFKYHNIVLRQVWERMKDQPDLLHAAIPVVTLAAATMPLALLGMWLKDRLRRDVIPGVAHMAGVHMFDLKKQKDRTPTDWLHDAVMASGMPGVYIGMFDNMLEAPKHGQPGIVALAGPTVGQVFNISARTADEWLPDAIPLVASTPGFRSAMRSGLRNTFGFGVRDEEE